MCVVVICQKPELIVKSEWNVVQFVHVDTHKRVLLHASYEITRVLHI